MEHALIAQTVHAAQTNAVVTQRRIAHDSNCIPISLVTVRLPLADLAAGVVRRRERLGGESENLARHEIHRIWPGMKSG
jgi:hypothetical protein